jgi:hypothetical protein
VSAGRAALIAFAVMTPGCNSGTFREPMTITDVIENIDRLNGRTVRVAGYLGECRGYDCHLFRNPAEKARLERLFEQARAGADSGGGPPPPVDETPVLSIGTGDGNDFDAKAGPFANSYVVITGRVTNQCRFNGRPDCTDRGPDLQPTGIAGWSGHP